MEEFNHKPVFLESSKCNGCVSCMKRCPTEAIRVRNGKAAITYERCVGCGECVKVCPTHAKKEYFDPFSDIHNYKYKIALPSPSLYGQFNNLTNTDYVLTGLKNLGFDDVFEVAYGAEIVSEATKQYLQNADIDRPLISSACPAVTNLILMRYEHLVPHLSPMEVPEAVAAKIALKNALEKTGLKREEIGIFVITQCASKISELKRANRSKYIDKVLSAKEIYFPLLSEMNKITELLPLAKAGSIGVSWGSSTGEAIGLGTDNYLSADGFENVMQVLNELEYDKLRGIEFLELNACPSGCVGGSMTIENPFLARTRLRLLRNKMKQNPVDVPQFSQFTRGGPYEPLNIFMLDKDRATAMKMTMKMKAIYEKLPQLDCGACGAPRCLAFAEDVVKGLDAKCKYEKENSE